MHENYKNILCIKVSKLALSVKKYVFLCEKVKHICEKCRMNVNKCSNLTSNAINFLANALLSVKVRFLTPVGAELRSQDAKSASSFFYLSLVLSVFIFYWSFI
jgi:hypothetical protein